MKYKTVKDILYDIFTEDEIKLEGYDAFIDATDRIHDPRPYPRGITQKDVDWILNSDIEILPYPSDEKKKRLKEVVRSFRNEHPQCDIYANTNEVEHCAIRGLCY